MSAKSDFTSQTTAPVGTTYNTQKARKMLIDQGFEEPSPLFFQRSATNGGNDDIVIIGDKKLADIMRIYLAKNNSEGHTMTTADFIKQGTLEPASAPGPKVQITQKIGNWLRR